MKTLITAATIAFTSTTAFAADLTPGEGLKTLAETGWADKYAAVTGSLAFDETGGNPFSGFTYAVPVDLSAADEVLGKGEFLAPHIAITPEGDIVVMVAPHLVEFGWNPASNEDDMLIKGANANKDNFVVISNGVATRYDYSEDIAK